ncbi:MAG: hypothetical protein PUH99_06015 [Firmicutes bacterium]|nr:hypothetical protein [Bacillota bacterium]MDY5531394.1 hypothetical protein [Pumilibacteraceae bacterium]
MGGRGTFAVGNNVQYQYETVEKIYGVKVLKGKAGFCKHGLPEESHSSRAYIGKNSRGEVRQFRYYNDNHTAIVDYDFSMHRGKTYLHAHDYVNGERQPARSLFDSELSRIGKYFGGKK